MAKSCGIEIPAGVNVSYYHKTITYSAENIRISVLKDDFWSPFGVFYNISIEVGKYYDSVLVYKNGWIHSVPKEMKDFVNSHSTRVNEINKHYKSLDVKNKYRDQERRNKLAEKNKKLKQHEDEKNKLLSMFK
jgi:hypothetical protein